MRAVRRFRELLVRSGHATLAYAPYIRRPSCTTLTSLGVGFLLGCVACCVQSRSSLVQVVCASRMHAPPRVRADWYARSPQRGDDNSSTARYTVTSASYAASCSSSSRRGPPANSVAANRAHASAIRPSATTSRGRLTSPTSSTQSTASLSGRGDGPSGGADRKGRTFSAMGSGNPRWRRRSRTNSPNSLPAMPFFASSACRETAASPGISDEQATSQGWAGHTAPC